MKNKTERKGLMALDFLKFIGPGLLVTIGFIDPGNWATNILGGSVYGYKLLWVVTLSTIILIFLQHNAAHIGIVTGRCLAESMSINLKKSTSRMVLSTAVLSTISTAFAEIMGGAIALNMLFSLPIKIGAVLIALFIIIMLFTNSYRYIERWIIGFVSLIGVAFILEIIFVKVQWVSAAVGWVTPVIPKGSMILVMSILGAVVMPHNLFLHSEVIQSRQWNLTDEETIKKQLKYEYVDTIFSMGVGWAINSAMIIVAASAFFSNNIVVNDLVQADRLLVPILGSVAGIVFAIALLLAGFSASITAGMAGGSIFSGIFKEAYDVEAKHTKWGVLITIIPAALVVFVISDPFKALIFSQLFLSIQLPITIFSQIYLSSSEKVMGKYKNSLTTKIILWTIGLIVSGLNAFLAISVIFGI